MEDRLKSCPFCSGEAEKEWGIPSIYWVRCTECGAEGGQYPSLKEAIEAWNTRKPMDRIVEQLKAELYRGMESLEPVRVAFNFGINRAIEIVKAGGKENET